MSKLRVHCFSVSLDGFGAGPNQTKDHPLGLGGERLHEWFFPTKTFQSMFGKSEGTTALDDELAREGTQNIGAWILGRNMFGPVRGPWPDDEWKGWWGSNPPYHVPVFVLTHHAREPIEMQGGTTFHFVTGGIEEALKRARDAAATRDVRLGGGVETIRQYLRAGLVDSLHLAMVPTVLGSGEPLWAGLDLARLGYGVAESRHSHAVMHVRIERSVAL